MSTVSIRKTTSYDYAAIKPAVDQVLADIGGIDDSIKPRYQVNTKPNLMHCPTDRLSGGAAYGAGRGHHERISVPKPQLPEPGADGGKALPRGYLCHGDTAFLKYSQIVKETVKMEHEDEDADDGEQRADGDLLADPRREGSCAHPADD